MFADDTNILISGKNLNEVLCKGNATLSAVYDWLCANKLSLNISKTKAMLFRTAQTNVPTDLSTALSLNGEPINFVKQFEFLGVIFDQNLSWKHHMLSVKNKIQATSIVISKIRRLLNHHTALSLYQSLILSKIRYCLSTWGFGQKSTQRAIQQKCNRILRTCLSLSWSAPLNQIMLDKKLLNLEQLIFTDISSIMYKIVNNEMTDSLDTLVYKSNISTRSNTRFIQTRSRLKRTKQCLHSRGANIWDSLPNDTKYSPDGVLHPFPTFRKNIKLYILLKPDATQHL